MKTTNRKILVVDDEADMRIFVSTVVETRGFEPVIAENGDQALKMAQLDPPALVILDVMMPKIDDGIRTYQHFRTNETLKQIPIIMLSAVARKTFFHTIRMLKPGQDRILAEPEAYMEKPPDAEELIRLIDGILAGEK
ncbi:MAG: response regulator [Desulfobacterales bacterium]|nr:response regulator [Desulfobacterales bacterium]